MPDTELFARSVELIERLCRETERLGRDVRRLAGRIEPFDGEIEPRATDYYKHPKNFRDVIKLIEETRKQVESCEFALNRTTSRIDQIVSDGWSREDLKPFLRDR